MIVCVIVGTGNVQLDSGEPLEGAHNMFHTSLLKRYLLNGEAVDPQTLTLIGGQDNQFEVERIVDFFTKVAA